MSTLKTNIFIKISIILIISLLLLIPTIMIQNLIREREQTQYEAIREVSSKWAEEQTISGPYLSIPYYKYVRQYSSKDSSYKVVTVKDYMHFLPTDLKIKGEISPEKRNRGIYDIVVYNSKLHISGTFDKITFSNPDIPRNNFLFDKAFLSIGISDLRGIEKLINHDIKRIEHNYPMLLTEVKPPRGGNNNNNNKKPFNKKRPNINNSFGKRKSFKPQNKNYKGNR